MRTVAFFLLFSLTSLHAQEICNDAIDNDNDGLIDLNDDDCICEDLMPQSFIPNPSFEERSCCPSNGSQLYCADDWIQASEATTDYLHTCGMTNPFWLGYTTPLPFPDGQGAIGFRDGKPGFPNFKEYTGSVLSEPLREGVEYRLDFYVGFHRDPSSRDFNMAVFASPDRNSIPFGNGNENFGCPTNGLGWVELGELSISGNNEWINVVFEFIPTQDYNVIVIGPGCARNPNFRDDPYFYFDRITLAERADFEIPFSNVEGGLCDDQIILSVEADDSFTYQWYHDGVAILGAVDPLFNLSTSDDFGEYNVLITTSSGCFLSESFELENGSTFSYDLVEICEGEQYVFGEDTLLTSGTYQDIIPISVICDSVIEIDFIVHPNEYFEIFDTICEGDTYTYANLSEMQSGDYIVEDQTQFGCLSETLIHLTVLEGIQNLELQTSVAIDLGESIVLEPIAYSSDIVSFEWSDENNIVLSNEIQYGPFLPLGPSIFYLTGTDKDGCSLTRSIEVEVEQNVEIYIPNIFYPKDILGNDKFKIGYTPAVKSIDIQIFDRWGNPVYNFEGAIENYEGWDGRYNNSNYVEQGVYTYLIKFELINSDVKIFAGDLTLIK